MSNNPALSETVIALSQIVTALIASVRKKDALDHGLFVRMIEEMRALHKDDGLGGYQTYNNVIETAKSSCLIIEEQPKASR